MNEFREDELLAVRRKLQPDQGMREGGRLGDQCASRLEIPELDRPRVLTVRGDHSTRQGFTIRGKYQLGDKFWLSQNLGLAGVEIPQQDDPGAVLLQCRRGEVAFVRADDDDWRDSGVAFEQERRHQAAGLDLPGLDGIWFVAVPMVGGEHEPARSRHRYRKGTIPPEHAGPFGADLVGLEADPAVAGDRPQLQDPVAGTGHQQAAIRADRQGRQRVWRRECRRGFAVAGPDPCQATVVAGDHPVARGGELDPGTPDPIRHREVDRFVPTGGGRLPGAHHPILERHCQGLTVRAEDQISQTGRVHRGIELQGDVAQFAIRIGCVDCQVWLPLSVVVADGGMFAIRAEK